MVIKTNSRHTTKEKIKQKIDIRQSDSLKQPKDKDQMKTN